VVIWADDGISQDVMEHVVEIAANDSLVSVAVDLGFAWDFLEELHGG
jgi:hypothetical protein